MITNKQPKGRTGKLKEPSGDFGKPIKPTFTIPPKPGGLGANHTHGSYTKGKKVGTKIN